MGAKIFYDSVVQKDRLDGVFHAEIGYLSKNLFSFDIGFNTGSIKRETNVIAYDQGIEVDYTSNINFSSSLDLLVGKIFNLQKFSLFAKAGANFSTIKIQETIRAIQPRYYVAPKIKVGIGIPLNKKNILTLNYHHVFSHDGKMIMEDAAPYNFRGFANYGMLTIGLQHIFN